MSTYYLFSILCALANTSVKIHLTEKFFGLRLLALASSRCWLRVLSCESGMKTKTWCWLHSMCHLESKITCLCLRRGLNFNLQTPACTCEGLSLLLCGQQVHTTKGPDVHGGIMTSLGVTGVQSCPLPGKARWMQIRSLFQHRKCAALLTTNRDWAGKKKTNQKPPTNLLFHLWKTFLISRQKYSLLQKPSTLIFLEKQSFAPKALHNRIKITL